MHAQLARQEVDELQMKLNARTKKKDELPTMSIPKRWLTSEEGKEQWKEQERQIEEKRQQKADKAARKEQAESEKQRRRQDIMLGAPEAVVFSGGLS